MARKSKTQLFKDLAEIDPARFADAPDKGLEHRHIGDETFGNDSCIFVEARDRAAMENELERRGHKITRTYWPGSNSLQVHVTYFKGWHWDE